MDTNLKKIRILVNALDSFIYDDENNITPDLVEAFSKLNLLFENNKVEYKNLSINSYEDDIRTKILNSKYCLEGKEYSFDIGQSINIEEAIKGDGINSVFCLNTILDDSVPLKEAKNELKKFSYNFLELLSINPTLNKNDLDGIVKKILNNKSSEYFKEYQQDKESLEKLKYYYSNLEFVYNYVLSIYFKLTLSISEEDIELGGKKFKRDILLDIFNNESWYIDKKKYFKLYDSNLKSLKDKLRNSEILEFCEDRLNKEQENQMKIVYDNNFPISIDFIYNNIRYRFVFKKGDLIPYEIYKDIDGELVEEYNINVISYLLDNIEFINEEDKEKCGNLLDKITLVNLILSNISYKQKLISESEFRKNDELLYTVWGKLNEKNQTR